MKVAEREHLLLVSAEESDRCRGHRLRYLRSSVAVANIILDAYVCMSSL